MLLFFVLLFGLSFRSFCSSVALLFFGGGVGHALCLDWLLFALCSSLSQAEKGREQLNLPCPLSPPQLPTARKEDILVCWRIRFGSGLGVCSLLWTLIGPRCITINNIGCLLTVSCVQQMIYLGSMQLHLVHFLPCLAVVLFGRWMVATSPTTPSSQGISIFHCYVACFFYDEFSYSFSSGVVLVMDSAFFCVVFVLMHKVGPGDACVIPAEKSLDERGRNIRWSISWPNPWMECGQRCGVAFIQKMLGVADGWGGHLINSTS